ncbi:MAG: RNA 2',3'-cyclic phosphodiesterase [Acidobacteriota bacterium]
MPTSTPSIRAFICIDIPPSLKTQIENLQNELRRIDAQVSWVKPANIHLTIKFLGDMPTEKIPQVIEAARHVTGSCSPFQLEASGAGVFPSPQNPNVLWIGLNDLPDALIALQQAIEDELSTIGIARESKNFNPHLTIGRIRNRRNARQLAEELIRRGKASDRFTVTEIIVMRSDLDPRGAIYTPLAVLPLQPPTAI